MRDIIKKEMELPQDEKKKIRDIGQKYDLKMILVYGSYAKGTQNQFSDLDIACMPGKPLNPALQMDIYGDLAGVFGDFDRDLDVVFLSRKDPLFLYQVAKNSKLLYGNDTEFNEFKAFAFRNYLDSKDLRELEKTLVLKFQGNLEKEYAR